MSIRQLTEELFPGRIDVQYGTVQKQLDRLEAKGFVARDRSLFVHLFSAAIDREALVGRRLDAVVDKLCDGSLAPIISHLLRNQKLSAAERRQLRELVDEAATGPDDQGPAPKGKSRRKE